MASRFGAFTDGAAADAGGSRDSPSARGCGRWWPPRLDRGQSGCPARDGGGCHVQRYRLTDPRGLRTQEGMTSPLASFRSARHPFALLLVIGVTVTDGCGSNSGTHVSDAGAGDRSVAPPVGAAGPHVVILSIDGMHGVDLDRYIVKRPDSALAALVKSGVRYADVSTPFPSDSFPGQIAVATGGTPKSTGVYYDLSYDRHLSPPNSDCSTKGAIVDFTEASDIDSSVETGGGGFALTALPRDPTRGCAPVFPHEFLRVNTTFEVVHEAGLRTAWFDKHLTYDVLNGPSGKGVDDLWNPEVAAKTNKSVTGALAYDDRKVDGLLNLLAGKDHTGTTTVGVPALFGMDFQSVSVAQKSVGNGYADATATPTATLLTAFDRTDASLGKIVAAIKAGGMWNSTTLIVTAVHGQAPIDPSLAKTISPSLLWDAVNAVQPNLLAHVTADGVALFWLSDSSMTSAVSTALLANADALGIESVLSGDAIASSFADPLVDDRVPDLIALVKPGVIYADKAKAGEHGGNSDDERKVLLLVGGGTVVPDVVTDPVETRQIAPTALAALGLDPGKLEAVKQEGTSVLPGIARTP